MLPRVWSSLLKVKREEDGMPVHFRGSVRLALDRLG